MCTALGNHVTLQPCYHSYKSQFMIMIQEKVIDTYASRTENTQHPCIFSTRHIRLLHSLLITKFQDNMRDMRR